MVYAWDALRRRPGRTAASALGIGLATALIVTLLAVSEGVQTSATELASSSGVDLIVTSGNTTLSGGQFPEIDHAHSLPTGFRSADPNVETASPWLIASLTFANGSLYNATNRSDVPAAWAPTSAGTIGWIPSESAGLELPAMLQGPGYPTLSDPHFSNGSYGGPPTGAIVLDQGLASVLHVGPGQIVYVSSASPSGPSALSSWFGGATAFRVAGVSDSYWLLPSALLAFTYLSELQTLIANGAAPIDGASLVLVHLFDPTQPSVDQAKLERAYPSISVFTLGDVLSEIQDAVSLYRTFGTMIGIIGLVVATLFATTILLMSVDDRSRELALLRAIGYPRSSVVLAVVTEGFLLCALGLAAGLGLGFAGAEGLERVLERLLTGLPNGFSFVRFDVTVVLQASAGVAAVGLFASILPSLRVLRLPIAEELRAP